VRRAQIGVVVAAVIAVLLFASAFVVASRSCEGGLELYFWVGALALVALFVVPFASHLGRSLAMRSLWAVVLGLAGVGVWLAGLTVANVRVICRLI
jgi:hypothetical protein